VKTGIGSWEFGIVGKEKIGSILKKALKMRAFQCAARGGRTPTP
tara:strand:+ start:1413 stop:1544 length:132 start_codon:yes stop_codon:yes gene_type:complete